MRRLSFTVAAGLLAALAGEARAVPDLRLLVGTDLYIANAPTSGATGDAELGLSLGAGGRGLGKGLFDFRFDFRGVFPLDGQNNSLNRPLKADLWNLYGVLHVSKLDITFGRFQAPGGFFLTTDGVSLRLHLLEDRLILEVYGGLRAFSAGRQELHLTDKPMALPLVGAAASFRNQYLHLSLSVTYAQDALGLHRGWICRLEDGTECPREPKDTLRTAANSRLGYEVIVDKDINGKPLIEHELFINAGLLLLPHPNWTIAGGLILGSRYDLQFSGMAAANFGVTGVDVAIIGSIDAYGMVDWRPIKRLRLAYLVQYDRTRIIQSRSLADGINAGGSFLDNTLKATVRVWRNVRFDLRYRLRYRENGDVIHRPELVLTGDAILFGFGLFASIGADLYSSYHPTFNMAPVGMENAAATFSLKDPSRVIYSGGASYIHKFVDVRAGVLFTDAARLGSLVSQPLSTDVNLMPAVTSHLFPFALESQRIAFLRAFFSWQGVFVGFDGEMNLDSNLQFRILAQAGYAR